MRLGVGCVYFILGVAYGDAVFSGIGNWVLGYSYSLFR